MLHLFLRSLKLARQEYKLLFALTFAAAGIAGAQILEPVLFGRVIDSLAKSNGFFTYLAVWGGVGLTNALFSIFVAIVADRLAHRQRLNAMSEAFEKTIALPYSYHSLTGSGKVVRSIIAGSDQIFFFYLSLFRENATALIGMTIIVPIAFMLEPRLACVLCALAVIYAVSNFFVIRRTHSKQAKVELRHQEVAARLVDVMGNVNVVRSFTRFKQEASLFRGLAQDVLNTQYPVLTWWGVLNVITRLSSMTAIVLIVAIGSYLVHAGSVTPGQVVTFVGFSTLMIGRLDQISTFFARIVAQTPTIQNLFDVIDKDMEPSGGQILTAAKGHVEFENLTFQYRQKGQGIFNLNFEAKPGETVALVGPSGSGKTTCINLLQKLFTPQLGRVLIDGHDIQELSNESICSQIASVFQEPGLFNRSIYDNILVGRPTATREEVEAAAKKADAHDFIMARPGAYDFVVGERGLALSGGERQRIAIARAILKDAPILILDEATSALDNETEKKIQHAMDALREGRTTFIIAHRLSTIVTANKIVVMNAGRIVESGTFSELQKMKGGLFSRLLSAGQLGLDLDFEETQKQPAPRLEA